MKIAIIVSQFNKKIGDQLWKGAEKALKKAFWSPKNYDVFEVPGAFEIPCFAQKLIDTKKYNGLIALGCIIKGETDHYRAVCDGVTYGIQKVSIENRIPVMFGVLMCKNMKQAQKRTNKGYECAIELIKLLTN